VLFLKIIRSQKFLRWGGWGETKARGCLYTSLKKLNVRTIMSTGIVYRDYLIHTHIDELINDIILS